MVNSNYGEDIMGFLSKLFSKKPEEPEVKVTIKPQISIAPNSSDIPPYQGDYAKTVFLWAHDKASPIRHNDDYPRYFLFECGISNPASYHKKLIQEGYFIKASKASSLNALKVTELKEILTTIGQPTTGKKDALIERILSTADEISLNSFCKEELFVLSETGEDFLVQHNNYIQLHKHKNWGIDWQEFDANYRPGFSFYDVVWGILNKRVIQDRRNFGRGEYLFMYQLLAEEGKRERAIEMLLRVLYIDLSGVLGMSCFDLYKSGMYSKKELYEYFNVAIMIAPGIINPISEFKDVYSDEIVDRLYEQKLPIQLCDKNLFLTLIHSILEGTYDEAAIENKLKSSYNKFIQML